MSAPKKKKATLNGLGGIDQDLVFEYCNRSVVTLEEACEWIKANYHIEMSSHQLGIWLRDERVQKGVAARLDQIREDSARAGLIGKAFGDVLDLNDVNTKMIQQAVFQELQKEPGKRDEKRLADYMNMAIRSRAQETREKAVALQARRFFFSATKAALKCASQLQEIDKGDEDEMEKIEKALVVLFGEEPERFESFVNPDEEIDVPAEEGPGDCRP
jgi:hypothetical protein